MGLSQEKGGKLQESSGKYFDKAVNTQARTEPAMTQGPRGGQRISKSIPFDTGNFRTNKRK